MLTSFGWFLMWSLTIFNAICTVTSVVKPSGKVLLVQVLATAASAAYVVVFWFN